MRNSLAKEANQDQLSIAYKDIVSESWTNLELGHVWFLLDTVSAAGAANLRR